MKLEVDENDLPIVRRMKSSLIKKFRPKSENDIEKAIELAGFLVALGKLDEARDFLESFIYLEPSLNDLHLWVTNAQGLVLLVYIARVSKDEAHYEKYFSILNNHDLWPADIGKFKWIKMHMQDHQKKVEYALSETQKYKCAILGQEVLTFLYFSEMLLVREPVTLTVKIRTKDVKEILASSQKMLVTALEE